MKLLTAEQGRHVLQRLESQRGQPLAAPRALVAEAERRGATVDGEQLFATAYGPVAGAGVDPNARAAFLQLVEEASLERSPDPLASGTTALAEAERVAMRSVFRPSSALEAAGTTNHGFKDWVHTQVTENPVTMATFTGIAELLGRADRPTTVGGLLRAAVEIARQNIDAIPGAPQLEPQRSHLAVATALLAMAGHNYFNVAGQMSNAFPHFLPDGRTNDWGHDKSRHCLNHAMFTFLVRYDRTYGDGKTAESFLRQVQLLDTEGLGAAVGALYESVHGSLGPLLKGYRVAPPETAVVYFARPSSLAPEEAEAYDAAVRMGDYYEAASTYPRVTVADLGREEGLKALDSTEGLSDPGTTRDMSANRIGAWLGVQLFRDPQTVPRIPNDVGKQLQGIPSQW